MKEFRNSLSPNMRDIWDYALSLPNDFEFDITNGVPDLPVCVEPVKNWGAAGSVFYLYKTMGMVEGFKVILNYFNRKDRKK